MWYSRDEKGRLRRFAIDHHILKVSGKIISNPFYRMELAVKMEIFQLFQQGQVGDTIESLAIVEEDCKNCSATLSTSLISKTFSSLLC